ncbi:hypothetical protein [Marinobacter nauticus]|uniref:hypothetical protein n=1 Tax=Marinobacter nauticus TaxID=2743 RepID=UPI001CD70D59|nr:hypothetical protein [Marinobacter nauticus]MCA0911761.1 hypothetical protein [Marinobacter nauticus]
MPVWAQILTQVLLTAATVTAVLFGFWFWVVKPWLAERIQELVDTANEIEPKVTSGVQKGVAESIRQIPQSAWDGATRESTRQFLKFGSNLFENGLSTFLGAAAEEQHANQARRSAEKRDR